MSGAIKKVAVLGAGLMGSQIAAHLANVGIPSLLLDIVPKELTPEEAGKGLTLASGAVRNRFALAALQKLAGQKPSPVYVRDVLQLITPGNFVDDLPRLAEVDWIVEAVVEQLTVKQELWQQVAAYCRPDCILSSNTSGISISAMADSLPSRFHRNFLGTHFFNPPRYMKLLELIPTAQTDPEILAFMKEFGERVLGKGVVIATDTPNFIANRIGTYGMMVTLEAMSQLGLGVDEVDALTGPVIGRPKSATFRTLDMVGLDTFCHVADNCKATIADKDEAAAFAVPTALREMVKRGWLGQKSGQGFFKRDGEQILTLDLEQMEYRPRRKGGLPSLEAAKAIADLSDRLGTLVYAKEKVGQFLWQLFTRTLLYSANKVGEIAVDILAIDRAMKWGFGWEIGPFEAWDAIGVARSVARMDAEGLVVPDWVRQAAAAGGFYRQESGRSLYRSRSGEYSPVAVDDRVVEIESLRAMGKVVHAKKGASLLDMGDGVLLLETHSPKTAVGADILAMMKVAAAELKNDRWRGLVMGARTENFCVGANLMLILMEAEEEEWDEVDLMVRQFQSACMALKYAPKPVVAAPYGFTLGGGYEIVAGADRILPAAETYMGLVEVGAGVIPAGGGTKEMLIRALEGIPGGLRCTAQAVPGAVIDIQPIVNKVFETIGLAKVSTSGPEAKELGYLRQTDQVVVNRDHQLYEAKQAVLALDLAGYKPPQPPLVRVVGPEGRAVLELGLYNLLLSGHASEYDCHIGRKLAYVLTGGQLPGGTYVTEQYLLDLEREAFLSLCGEPKSRARMQAILKTGKPLRN